MITREHEHMQDARARLLAGFLSQSDDAHWLACPPLCWKVETVHRSFCCTDRERSQPGGCG